MDSDDGLVRRMRRLSDEDLLDIVEGRRLGYRQEAVVVAQEALRDRGVPFEAVDPTVLTKAYHDFYERLDLLAGLWARRQRGRYVAAAGTAALFVWFTRSAAERHIVLAMAGLLGVVVGVIIVIPTERTISRLGPAWDAYEGAVRRGQRKARDLLKVGGFFLLFVFLVSVASAVFL